MVPWVVAIGEKWPQHDTKFYGIVRTKPERLIFKPADTFRQLQNSPHTGIIDVIQQQDADHYERIATYETGSAAATGLFVPELAKLFVAVHGQPTGQDGEYLVYETK